MSSRTFALGIIVLLLAATAVSAAFAVNNPTPAAPKTHTVGYRTIGVGQIRFQGHGPEWWAAETRRLGRAFRGEEFRNDRLSKLNGRLERRNHRLEERNQRLAKRARHVQGLLASWIEKSTESFPTSAEYAIRLAAVVYGIPESELDRVASCESGHNPRALNASSSASGLFQFLPSTWSGGAVASRYSGAGFSVWDPIANALAAAGTVAHDGGWGQWECKP